MRTLRKLGGQERPTSFWLAWKPRLLAWMLQRVAFPLWLGALPLYLFSEVTGKPWRQTLLGWAPFFL